MSKIVVASLVIVLSTIVVFAYGTLAPLVNTFVSSASVLKMAFGG